MESPEPTPEPPKKPAPIVDPYSFTSDDFSFPGGADFDPFGDGVSIPDPFNPTPAPVATEEADLFTVEVGDDSDDMFGTSLEDRVAHLSDEAPAVSTDLLSPQLEVEAESVEESSGEVPSLELAEAEAPVVEPEPELDPEAEAARRERIRNSLSIEDESSTLHVNQAKDVRARNQDADVATLIRAYRKAIEEHPDNLVLRTDLADIHLRYGLLEDAVVQYRQIVKRNPKSICLHHRLIQAHLWNENHEEAAATLMELSILHTEQGDHQDALDILQTVLSLDPHHVQARRALVDRFTALEETKLASHHLRQLAEAALTKGSVDEAISAFKQLMAISDDTSFQDRLAQVYESQGETELALENYRQLVERHRQAEKWEEAASTTERIVSLAPENLETRAELIDLYERLGLRDKVLEQKTGLARFHHDSGQVQAAAGLYEQVLAVQADNHEVRRYLVDAYLAMRRVDDALKQCDSLTEHYVQTKDHATAVDLYSRLVDAQPENIELREKLIKFYNMAEDPENAMEQWLLLAQLHGRYERWEASVDAYRKALTLDESRAELHYSLARLYLEKLNNLGAAIQEFHRVYELDPGHAEAMSKYARMLLRMGKAKNAAEVLNRLVQNNPENGKEVRDSILGDFKARIEQEPSDLRARFIYGEICFHLSELDLAIEQFQQTRKDGTYELKSYNMLGLCFAEKHGFNMLDLAIKQFRKGLETAGHSEQEYLELRYNLAMLQYRNNRLQEALQELKDCYAVDIAYKDVREWIRRIESEIAGGPKVSRIPARDK